MSVKIYYAWRFPANRLEEFLGWSREVLRDAVYARYRDLMAMLPEEEIPECPDRFKDHPAVWDRGKRARLAMVKVEAAAKSPYRDSTYDLECGFNLWPHKRHFYVIPIMDQWLIKVLEQDKNRPEWVENYAYWNNTDGPDDVTRKEWLARRKYWEAVCIDDHNKNRLFFEVVELKTTIGRDRVVFDNGYRELWNLSFY